MKKLEAYTYNNVNLFCCKHNITKKGNKCLLKLRLVSLLKKPISDGIEPVSSFISATIS